MISFFTSKVKNYLIISLVVAFAVSGVATKLLWDKNSSLSDELYKEKLKIAVYEKNAKLVSEQLAEEKQRRAVIEATYFQLREVPDAQYKTELPEGISNTLIDFRNRMQNHDNSR